MTGWRTYELKRSGKSPTGADLDLAAQVTAPLWDASLHERGQAGRFVGTVREYRDGTWRADILAPADGTVLCSVSREAGEPRRYTVADGTGGLLGSFEVNSRRYWFRRHTWVVTSAGRAPVRAVRGRWWAWLLCLFATPVMTVVLIALDGSLVIFTPHLFGWRFRDRGARVATVGERLKIRSDDPDPRLWLAAWVVAGALNKH